ncbi:hypothetical protein ACHAXA_006659 [Cyclostephanos tholiformis]|uniref:Uncharacterized protein n=1 Tax=Cyclostephanos tholiformis TaxID=382380 RepID=A0ABD3R456_9STRA
MGCSAFIHHRSPPPFSTVIHSTTGSSVERILYHMSVRERVDSSQEHDPGGGLELWLDLRGTSLSPRTALELWDMEERQGGESCSDRSPDAPFVKCLISSAETSFASPSQNSVDEFTQNIEVLLVAEGRDDEDMRFILQQADPSKTSMCIGRLLSVQASSSKPILPDPLPFMEVASNGQWIVIDTDGWKKIEEEERLRMALPLFGLLSTSSRGGGIGLTCHTKNEVVKTVMFIQSMTNGGGSNGRQMRTITLESGIIIPENDTPITSASANPTMTPLFAIVVPYDMELIRTAKLLFADKETAYYGESDEIKNEVVDRQTTT